ncbi:uncharacterized protein LOC128556754 isoform X2 [Mercenaria mercenaria]|uniref:uncharacterized protein LOC128556754 isoform X2 n=1 Tax=Mercenaria mercenaria TaxID=6596 RepID=UPI00234E6B94|nr:uncharacterized protein LOC128556754 isoform X2 [Mercenaria mercenaria]
MAAMFGKIAVKGVKRKHSENESNEQKYLGNIHLAYGVKGKGIKRNHIENESQEQIHSDKIQRTSIQERGEVGIMNVLAISGRGNDIGMTHSLADNDKVGDRRASMLEERVLGNTMPATSWDCGDMEISRDSADVDVNDM